MVVVEEVVEAFAVQAVGFAAVVAAGGRGRRGGIGLIEVGSSRRLRAEAPRRPGLAADILQAGLLHEQDGAGVFPHDAGLVAARVPVQRAAGIPPGNSHATRRRGQGILATIAVHLPVIALRRASAVHHIGAARFKRGPSGGEFNGVGRAFQKPAAILRRAGGKFQGRVRRVAADVSINPAVPSILIGVGNAVAGGGKHIVAVAGKHDETQAELAHVVGAFDALRLLLGAGQRGQEHRGENGDDGDDHQQLDEGERRFFFNRVQNNFHGIKIFQVTGRPLCLLQ